MNKIIIEAALGAGLGALTLLKELRALEEVNVSNKPWRSGVDGVEQKRKWIKAKDKLMSHELPPGSAISGLKNMKVNQIYDRLANQKIQSKKNPKYFLK